VIFNTIKSNGVDIKLWIPVHEVESSALTQLKNVASIPGVSHHLAVMPDVHTGVGATIGTIFTTKSILMPAAVGVDIGCGMDAVNTRLRREDLCVDNKELRQRIEAAIPTGFASRTAPFYEEKILRDAKMPATLLLNRMPIVESAKDIRQPALLQLGTLGGGNHFIELSAGENGHVWVVLHSGSRNIGKTIAEHHLRKAKEVCKAPLADRNLAFFQEEAHVKQYYEDADWARTYAYLNRSVMLSLVLQQLEGCSNRSSNTCENTTDFIRCCHNYVAIEEHYGQSCYVTRKGAISAKHGEWGIIPGSMGSRTYLVKGLGNPESFNSASHGAGRAMSRGEAKRRFSLEDIVEQTEGVECRKDKGILDELPSAYKDIDVVMERQQDLVRPVRCLRPFICIKG
jgi:tRNA-splicing ligase RtcB